MGKLIRAVLRGRNGGNTILLPDHYEKEGKDHKLYGFVAILGYSRMRFITFVKRCDTPTMIRCMRWPPLNILMACLKPRSPIG